MARAACARSAESLVTRFPQLPTLAAVQAARVGKAIAKGKTRLEAQVSADRTDALAERAFRAAVWKRDQGKCRVCGCRVVRTLTVTPKRGDVHHIAPRAVRAVRFDPRNGLLVCAMDHERLQQHRLHMYASSLFWVNNKEYVDAGGHIMFASMR